MGIATHTLRAYTDHQSKYLLAAVEAVWGQHLGRLHEEIKEGGHSLTIRGDGRADSPGHSAKYGTYTAIELGIKKIVDIQVVQVPNYM